MQDNEAITFCPSFNSYSSDKFAEIANKVTKECIRDDGDARPVSNELDDDDNDDFEFSLVRGDSDVTADKIFASHTRQSMIHVSPRCNPNFVPLLATP
ncbi:unnamed protein product [Camellia sinensis]